MIVPKFVKCMAHGTQETVRTQKERSACAGPYHENLTSERSEEADIGDAQLDASKLRKMRR